MRAHAPLLGLAIVFMEALASAQCPNVAHVDNPDAIHAANDGDRLRASDIDGAIAKYTEATSIDPDDHRLWWKLALAYEKKEDWAKVVTACTAAESAAAKAFGKKTHADYYVHHGIALARLAAAGSGSWVDAIAALEAAVAIDPSYAAAFGELGDARARVDDDVGAIRAWTKAIQRSPETLRYYVALADLYRRWMFFDHAEKVLTEALTFAKSDDKDLYATHALLGDVYMTKGDVARAVGEYERAKASCAATSCVDHRDATYRLGTAYAALTPPRKNEAIQLLQTFWKTTCKGSLAQRYADACADTVDTASRLGLNVQ